MSWTWDPSLYAGSAAHYPVGRIPYPPALGTSIRDALGLDGTGRLLDVGCGPGSLTTLLAPSVNEAVGVDADPDMIAEAPARPGVTFRRLRAEELPAGLGTFRVVTFAQSFHWLDRPLVAGRVRPMIAPGGAWVHVSAETHRGVPGTGALPHPLPPWAAIQELVVAYLGPQRRAGRGVLPQGTPGGEDEIMRAAGYSGPERLEVARDEPVVRDAAAIEAAVFSLSFSAPHLFGDRLDAFTGALREVLRGAAPDGRFAERFGPIGVAIWRP